MKKNSINNNAALNGEKISDILRALPDKFLSSDITIGELKNKLSGRAYGILLLVLAFPNIFPIPVPGISAMLGIPLIFVTFQLMLGKESPWLPKFVSNRKIQHSHLQRVCTSIIPYMEKFEIIIKPRIGFLVKYPVDRIIALICVVLSLMIALPIPLGNALPGLAICLFAIGLLQADGLFIICGTLVALIGATVIPAFLSALYLLFSKFFAGS